MLYLSIIPLLTNLWNCLGPKRRKQFLLLIILILLSSVAEMVSIGAIVPFLGMLVNPEVVFNHTGFQFLKDLLSISRPEQLLFPITILFCLAAISAGGLRLLLTYATSQYSFSVGADFSFNAYRRTLYQPYSIHISRNSSEIITGITGKVATLVGSVITPSLTLITSGFLTAAILLALIMIDAAVAVSVSLVLGGIYLALVIYSRRDLRKNSECIARESTQVVKALQEGLGGIRDVLLDGTQEVYCGIYRDADRPLQQALARNVFVSVSPRYLMEILGMVVIASLALTMAQRNGGLSSSLPVLGALALCAQRLLPVLQQGYSAFTSIMGAEASLRDALELLNQPVPSYALEKLPSKIQFQSEISLKNIGYKYTNASAWVLRNININIPKGSRVGFVGVTGSGKSTLLDIIMSLLVPVEGELKIDGKLLAANNSRAWQAHLAHVPQSIFLADSTIEENIAFGVPQLQIDHNRVRLAAQKAQIAEVIESWPNQYRTSVGERGVRLSGGQRQRIGIARALYKQADVIIFDEATSALDVETEKAVMEAIDRLDSDLTILIVAHRLSTLRGCDFIVSIGDSGACRICSYEELCS